jgi:hypothetical protein
LSLSLPHSSLEITMWQRQRTKARAVTSPCLALSFLLLPLFGCDSTSAVREIPEQSKQALVKRKVDVTPGKAGPSRSGAPAAAGRISGR